MNNISIKTFRLFLPCLLLLSFIFFPSCGDSPNTTNNENIKPLILNDRDILRTSVIKGSNNNFSIKSNEEDFEIYKTYNDFYIGNDTTAKNIYLKKYIDKSSNNIEYLLKIDKFLLGHNLVDLQDEYVPLSIKFVAVKPGCGEGFVPGVHNFDIRFDGGIDAVELTPVSNIPITIHVNIPINAVFDIYINDKLLTPGHISAILSDDLTVSVDESIQEGYNSENNTTTQTKTVEFYADSPDTDKFTYSLTGPGINQSGDCARSSHIRYSLVAKDSQEGVYTLSVTSMTTGKTETKTYNLIHSCDDYVEIPGGGPPDIAISYQNQGKFILLNNNNTFNIKNTSPCPSKPLNPCEDIPSIKNQSSELNNNQKQIVPEIKSLNKGLKKEGFTIQSVTTDNLRNSILEKLSEVERLESELKNLVDSIQLSDEVSVNEVIEPEPAEPSEPDPNTGNTPASVSINEARLAELVAQFNTYSGNINKSDSEDMVRAARVLLQEIALYKEVINEYLLIAHTGPKGIIPLITKISNKINNHTNKLNNISFKEATETERQEIGNQLQEVADIAELFENYAAFMQVPDTEGFGTQAFTFKIKAPGDSVDRAEIANNLVQDEAHKQFLKSLELTPEEETRRAYAEAAIDTAAKSTLLLYGPPTSKAEVIGATLALLAKQSPKVAAALMKSPTVLNFLSKSKQAMKDLADTYKLPPGSGGLIPCFCGPEFDAMSKAPGKAKKFFSDAADKLKNFFKSIGHSAANFIAKERANLLNAINLPAKGGYTKAGHALSKHGNRSGSKFPPAQGNPSQVSQQAEEIVRNILDNPASTLTQRHHARFGDVTEIYAPNGQGLRFNSINEFIGFIEK